jgi:hypothetical protein
MGLCVPVGVRCDSADFYDEMDSQSAFQLAEIYQPFDVGKRLTGGTRDTSSTTSAFR